MSRLQPCPACARHIRVSASACPFCATALATAAAPSRLSMALLGLCLAACTSGKDVGTQPAAASDGAPDAVAPPQTSVEPDQPIPPSTDGEAGAEQAEAGAGETSADEAGGTEGGVAGTDEGAAVDEPKPPAKPMYGAPRPATKYGGPPKPLAPEPKLP